MFWNALLKELLQHATQFTNPFPTSYMMNTADTAHCHTPLLTTFTGTLPSIKAEVEDSVVEILVCRSGI